MTDLPTRGLRLLAMPVVAVAGQVGDRRSCSTTTVTYASLDPMTLIVSLARHSTTTALVLESRAFSASVLSVRQTEVALAASRRGSGLDKFAELGIAVVDADEDFTLPSVAGSPVSWCCRVTSEEPVGDHVVLIGEVASVRGEPDADAQPLLRHDRQYVGLGPALVVQDEGGYPL